MFARAPRCPLGVASGGTSTTAQAEAPSQVLPLGASPRGREDPDARAPRRDASDAVHLPVVGDVQQARLSAAGSRSMRSRRMVPPSVVSTAPSRASGPDRPRRSPASSSPRTPPAGVHATSRAARSLRLRVEPRGERSLAGPLLAGEERWEVARRVAARCGRGLRGSPDPPCERRNPARGGRSARGRRGRGGRDRSPPGSIASSGQSATPIAHSAGSRRCLAHTRAANVSATSRVAWRRSARLPRARPTPTTSPGRASARTASSSELFATGVDDGERDEREAERVLGARAHSATRRASK